MLRHSGLGIASFIISLGVGLIMFILVVIAGIMEASTPGGIDEESAQAIVLGLCLIGGLLVIVAGLGLGIAGCLQRNRKKIFAILGLIFNRVIILGVIGLFIIGTFAG